MNHLYFVDRSTGLIVLTDEGAEIFDEYLCCECCGASIIEIEQLKKENERLWLENESLAANKLEALNEQRR